MTVSADGEKPLLIASIYTLATQHNKPEFYEGLTKWVAPYWSTHRIILGGDWNGTLRPEDQSAGTYNPHRNWHLAVFASQVELVDVHATTNPQETLVFMWKGGNKPGSQQKRLDALFTSCPEEFVTCTHYKDYFHSDHSLVVASAGLVLPMVCLHKPERRPKFVTCPDQDKLVAFNSAVADELARTVGEGEPLCSIEERATRFHCAVKAVAMAHLVAAPPVPREVHKCKSWGAAQKEVVRMHKGIRAAILGPTSPTASAQSRKLRP